MRNLKEMDIESLEEIADRMGYKLVKKPEPLPKLLPCPRCGSKQRYLAHVYGKGYSAKYYSCRKCKFKADHGRNELERRKNWNAACVVELELKKDGDVKDE